MEGPEGGGQMPVPADAAQARFAEQVNRMVKTLRRLHYAYRTPSPRCRESGLAGPRVQSMALTLSS